MPRPSNKEAWTTTKKLVSSELQVQLEEEPSKPGPRSWKEKNRKQTPAKEERRVLDVDDRAVADVDDLLLSGSDLDEDDAKSGGDNLNEREEGGEAEVAGAEEEIYSDSNEDDNIVLESSNLLDRRSSTDDNAAIDAAPMKEDDNPKNKMEGIISQDGAKDDKIKVDSEKLKAEVDKTGVEASKHEMEVASADDGGETGGGRRARDTSARQGGKTECSICGLKLAQGRLESHESMPHPIACTQPGCKMMFILEKSMERHKKTTHAQSKNQSRLILQCQVQNEIFNTDSKDSFGTESSGRTEDELDIELKSTKEEEFKMAADNKMADENDSICQENAETVSDETNASKTNQDTEEFEKEEEKYENNLEKETDYGGSDSIDPEVGPFICKFCKEEFKNWSILTSHFVTPHIFKCKFCELAFNRKTSMEDHENEFHDPVSLLDSTQCPICGEKYVRPSTLARHLQAPHDWECRKCDRKFTTRALLNKHVHVCPNKKMKLPDSDEEKPAKVLGKGKKRRSAEKKGKGNLRTNSDSEEDSKTPVKRKKMAEAKRKISTDDEGGSEDEMEEEETELKKSNKVQRVDSTESEESVEAGSKEAASNSDDEITLAKRKKMQETPVAKKKTQSKMKAKPAAENGADELLKDHARPKSPSAQCTICGADFVAKNLKTHMKKNHKHPCTLCDKRFILKTKLKQHLKTHKKIKAAEEIVEGYECPLCGFDSENIEDIEEHQEVLHDIDCGDCEKKFPSEPRIIVHRWSAHGAALPPALNCDICGKPFQNADGDARLQQLEEHIFADHRLDCEKCGVLYSEEITEGNHVCGTDSNDSPPSERSETPIERSETPMGHTTPDKMLDEISEVYPGETTVTDESGTTCSKCGIEFAGVALRRAHAKLPHPNDCNDCDLHFVSEARLKYHSVISHDAEETIKTECPHCQLNFRQIVSYLDHIETPHKHKCDECEKRYVDLFSLEQHTENVHPAPMVCKHCDQDFTGGSSSDYKEHTSSKHKYQCYVCDKTFIKRHHRDKHMQSSHEDAEVKCRMCAKDFGDFWQQLDAHLGEPHKWKCANCEMKFVEKEEKEKHALDVHGVVKGLDLRCGRCEEEFSDTAKFREHFKVPHNSPCAECELKFPSSRALETHVAVVHAKTEKLVCGMCKKKFSLSDKVSYTQHLETPHPHECDVCESTFIKVTRLKEHMEERHARNKHLDDKYTCKLCGAVCTRNNDSKQSREALKKHSMVPHKFPCKSCSLRFPNKAKLEAHFLENHVNAAAKHNDCSICGNHFSDPKVLKDHKKRPHTHACKNRTCERKFISELSLEKHLQRKHKEFANAKLQGGKVVFICKLCDQVFEHHLGLQSHQHVAHAHSCHVCDKQFVNKPGLVHHLKTRHNINKIPEPGFNCPECCKKMDKMIDIRRHMALLHRFVCSYCTKRFITKPQLDGHKEEMHMESVMMEAMEPPKVEIEAEKVAMTAEQSKLGVNLILWTESKYVRSHLHKVMAGRADSFRHKMFQDQKIRQITFSSEDSDLYKMSAPRYLRLPVSNDQAVIDVLLDIYRSGPVLPCPPPGYEYIFCVMIPELWILYLTQLKKMSRSAAEQKYKKPMDLETAQSAWLDLDAVLSAWRLRKDGARATTEDEILIIDEHSGRIPRVEARDPRAKQKLTPGKTDDHSQVVRPGSTPQKLGGQDRIDPRSGRKKWDPRGDARHNPPVAQAKDLKLQKLFQLSGTDPDSSRAAQHTAKDQRSVPQPERDPRKAQKPDRDPRGIDPRSTPHADRDPRSKLQADLEPKSTHIVRDSRGTQHADLRGTPYPERDPRGTPHAGRDPRGTQHADRDPRGTPHADREHRGTQHADRDPRGTQHAERDPRGTQHAERDPRGTQYAERDPRGTQHADRDPRGTQHAERDPRGTQHADRDPRGFLQPDFRDTKNSDRDPRSNINRDPRSLSQNNINNRDPRSNPQADRDPRNTRHEVAKCDLLGEGDPRRTPHSERDPRGIPHSTCASNKENKTEVVPREESRIRDRSIEQQVSDSRSTVFILQQGDTIISPQASRDPRRARILSGDKPIESLLNNNPGSNPGSPVRELEPGQQPEPIPIIPSEVDTTRATPVDPRTRNPSDPRRRHLFNTTNPSDAAEDTRSLSENYANEDLKERPEKGSIATESTSKTPPSVGGQTSMATKPAAVVLPGIDPALLEKLADSVSDPESFWNLGALVASPAASSEPSSNQTSALQGLPRDNERESKSKSRDSDSERSKSGERRRSRERHRSRSRERHDHHRSRAQRRHSRSRSRDHQHEGRRSRDDRVDRRGHDDRRSHDDRRKDRRRSRSRNRDENRRFSGDRRISQESRGPSAHAMPAADIFRNPDPPGSDVYLTMANVPPPFVPPVQSPFGVRNAAQPPNFDPAFSSRGSRGGGPRTFCPPNQNFRGGPRFPPRGNNRGRFNPRFRGGDRPPFRGRGGFPPRNNNPRNFQPHHDAFSQPDHNQSYQE